MRDRTLRISVIRPYRSVEELLAAEAWAISERTVVLVGAAPHSEGAALEFELALSDAQVLMRGQGTVIKYYPARGARPSGLAVRVVGMDEAGLELVHTVEQSHWGRDASSPPHWSRTPSAPPTSGGSRGVGEAEAMASPSNAVDPWGSTRQMPLARSASVVPAARRGPSLAPTAAAAAVHPLPPPPDCEPTPSFPTGLPGESPPPPDSHSAGFPLVETSEPSLAAPPSSQRGPADWDRIQALQRLRERRK